MARLYRDVVLYDDMDASSSFDVRESEGFAAYVRHLGGSASGKTRLFTGFPAEQMGGAHSMLYGTNPCGEIPMGEIYAPYSRKKEDEARMMVEGSLGEGDLKAMSPDEAWAFMRVYARTRGDAYRLLQERGEISSMRSPGTELACDQAARKESIRLYHERGGWAHVESLMRVDAQLAQAALSTHHPPCTNKRSRPWRAAASSSSLPSSSTPSVTASSKKAGKSPPSSPSTLRPPRRSSDGRFSFGLEWFSGPTAPCVREQSIDALAFLTEGAV